MELVLVAAVFFLLISPVLFGLRKPTEHQKARIPSPAQVEGNRIDVLNGIQNALTNEKVGGNTWKITERVDRIGRLQAKCDIPLGDGRIIHTILLNVSVVPSNEFLNHCTVEWSYIPMAPMGHAAVGLHLIENEMYVQTSMRIRAALMDVENFSGNRAIENEVGDRVAGIGRTMPAPESDKFIEDVEVELAEKRTGEIEAATIAESLASEPVAQIFESTAPELKVPAGVAIPGPEQILQTTGGQLPQSAAPKTCPQCAKEWEASFPFCIYCGFRPS